ncbi:polysaccharide lyase 8 family protein [Roseateles violae]|uniref:Polysaccharide lyase 8 family protein n=1 Tax=Roseateles violae TaxID=3058042 RepID=A0ABT8DLT3_9BURK|nr:polysaccharide lyase 8 family protein [Pelomonas sp. PFR6]MDN3919374.1 polysaccharide lyase 8 family protein [Pelomonas sp. PFR6]
MGRPIFDWTRAAAGALALVATLARADEYDELRQRWLSRLTAGPTTVRPDGEARPIDAAQRSWRSMERTVARQALWPELVPTTSGRMTESYRRLRALALAYSRPGSPLYRNAELLRDVIAGLDWLYQHHYNPSGRDFGNWWDWQIGSPLILADIGVLLHAELGEERLARYLAAIDHFVPDPTHKQLADGRLIEETGANRLDKAMVVALRGVLGKRADKIAAGRDAVSQVLQYVDRDDGFYRDGSFIQHHAVPYAGGYGVVALNDMAQLMYLLNGTSWAIRDPQLANVYDWVENSFRPFVFNGIMLDAVSGRKITRRTEDERATGRGVVGAVARLAEVAPPAKAQELRAIVKGWLLREAGPAQPLSPSLQAIASDDSIRPADEPQGVRLFASQDRAQLRGPGFVWQLSLFSDRISAFSSGNGENLRGWWVGMGTAQLYQAGPSPQGDSYWATVDMKRLPGTTTDHSGQGVPKPFTMQPNTSAWVGGAVLGGQVAALGMEFSTAQVTGSRLQGRKSWFLFGDKVLALGSGIATPDKAAVETIVDNRMLDAAHPRLLQVDGKTQPDTIGWTRNLDAARWAHRGGGGFDAGVGYVFPGGAKLTAWREQRQGRWSDVGPGLAPDPANDELLTRQFAGLSIDHGDAPQQASYAYAILPGRSAAQTEAFAKKPSVAVLLNTAEAAVACDAETHATGANVWAPLKAPLRIAGHDWLRADSALALVLRRQGDVLELALADPTQRITQAVHIELGEAVLETLAADPRITVEQTQPTLRLAVRFDGLAGASVVARFKASRLPDPACGG